MTMWYMTEDGESEDGVSGGTEYSPIAPPGTEPPAVEAEEDPPPPDQGA